MVFCLNYWSAVLSDAGKRALYDAGIYDPFEEEEEEEVEVML